MVWVKRIALGIVVFVAAAILISFALPRYPVVVRSTSIAASPAAIFPLVSDLRRFNEWSPWFDLDPAATYTFTGPTDGVGQTMTWESKDSDVGSGSMSITRLQPDGEVDTALDLDGQRADSWVKVEPEGAGSTVSWGFRTDVGYNPIMRYFALGLDRFVGPDYERGLAKLKAAAEKSPANGI